MGLKNYLAGIKSAITGGHRPVSSHDLMKLLLRGRQSKSGVEITDDSAMRQATFYSCVRVVSEDLAKMPLLTYRRNKDGGKDRANDHWLYELLHDQPNEVNTSFDFIEMAQAMLMLRGNNYAFINWTKSGRIVEVLPFHPDNVAATRTKNWTMEYKYNGEMGSDTFTSKNIWHIRGLSLNGWSGITPIAYMRETLGLALATEEHGSRLFSNGLNRKGVIKHPKQLSDEAYARLKAELADEGGLENSFKPLLLEDGLDWKETNMTNDDAQFLDTRKFQRDDICGMMRVPPHKVANLERAHFNNVEQAAQDYVSDSLLPWIRRWEASIRRDLIPKTDRPHLLVNFLVEGLLRGDTQARGDFYSKMFKQGVFSTNDILEMENRNKIGPEGDVRYVEGNLMKLGRESIRSGGPDQKTQTDPADGGVSHNGYGDA